MSGMTEDDREGPYGTSRNSAGTLDQSPVQDRFEVRLLMRLSVSATIVLPSSLGWQQRGFFLYPCNRRIK